MTNIPDNKSRLGRRWANIYATNNQLAGIPYCDKWTPADVWGVALDKASKVTEEAGAVYTDFYQSYSNLNRHDALQRH